jgi:hypothetical protein
MYYLNVLAGPAVDRSMAFCDDPAHSWVRDNFDREATDPRCPVTSAHGRLDGLTMPGPRAPAAAEVSERPPEDRSTP